MDLKSIFFLYDDTERLPYPIESIVGSRSYGQILYKKIKIKDRIKRIVESAGLSFIYLSNSVERDNILNLFREETREFKLIHLFSRGVIINEEEFIRLLEKVSYSLTTLVNKELDPFLLLFNNFKTYESYINLINQNKGVTLEDFNSEVTLLKPTNCFTEISELSDFLMFFSGGTEARFFNQIIGDNYTFTKKSNDKIKMKKEYEYYHLIPDEMKKWFVMPYNFKESDKFASYTMERLIIPDFALQWIHNSINLEQFELFLDKIFAFIESRPKKVISKNDYKKRFDELYVNKVVERIEKLKNLQSYKKINFYVENGVGLTLDDLFNDYIVLKNKINELIDSHIEVIGHGDLCFSNILYDKRSYTLKFIDTKGALIEEELWTDPYYDLAKLSHSIVGNYDFINNDLFLLEMDTSLKINLSIRTDNLSKYRSVFYRKLEDHGYDMRIVRLCELSLFLSMLPLHIDNPRKVLAFILNASYIEEELKKNV